MKTSTLARRSKFVPAPALVPAASDTPPAAAPEISPATKQPTEREKAIARQLWASLSTDQFWLADERVDMMEVRSGKQYHIRAYLGFVTPIPLLEALLQISAFASARRGMLRLSSGARIIFNFSDRPAFSVRKVEISLDGKKLRQMFSTEVYDLDD